MAAFLLGALPGAATYLSLKALPYGRDCLMNLRLAQYQKNISALVKDWLEMQQQQLDQMYPTPSLRDKPEENKKIDLIGPVSRFSDGLFQLPDAFDLRCVCHSDLSEEKRALDDGSLCYQKRKTINECAASFHKERKFLSSLSPSRHSTIVAASFIALSLLFIPHAILSSPIALSGYIGFSVASSLLGAALAKQ